MSNQNQVIETRTCTPNGALAAVRRCFKTKRPIFLWGQPGIGKSEIVEQLASEMGGYLIDLRLGQMDPTDIRGIPYFNKEAGVMDWAPPVELPSEELAAQYPVVVLFLDEMNTAAQSVQAAAYQLILNRRVGKYKLPDNVVIVAAGNREGDRGVTYRMPTPLANRFVHIEMRCDFNEWADWAVLNGISPDVVGYLSFEKSALNDFKPSSSERAFATPRTWAFVSQLLEDEAEMSHDTMMDLVTGTVGSGHALSFMAHRKHAASLPNPSHILDGTVTEMKTNEISAQYTLVVSMCYELRDRYKAGVKEAEFNAMCDRFLAFMLKNFTPELCVMGGRQAITVHKLPMVPSKLKSFGEYHRRFGTHLANAI